MRGNLSLRNAPELAVSTAVVVDENVTKKGRLALAVSAEVMSANGACWAHFAIPTSKYWNPITPR